MASALWTSRDGTMERDTHLHLLPGGVAPPAAAAGVLRRWDPWVRSTLAVTELTNGLTYVPTPLNVSNVYEVQCVTGAGTPAAATQTLVKLTRPDQPFFIAQLGFVQSWAELRDERAAEILAQIDNQFAFIAAATGLNVVRKKYTMEWLMVAVQFTIEVELMFKHAFACYRPVEFSPQVQPIVTTPGHGTYPMGHAAQAFATIVALSGLLGIHPAQFGGTHPAFTQLRLQARRFSVNRVVAGVHFPIDAPAGQVLGTSLGEYFLHKCGIANVPCNQRTFAPNLLGNDILNNFLGDGPDVPNGASAPVALGAIAFSPYLMELTALAQSEWA
jgi:hypothetical protein